VAEHYPVLLEEVEQHLAIDPGGVYVDCTLGAAGYAERILSRLETGELIAIDRDESAIAAAREKLADYGAKVTYYHGSFSEIDRAAGPDATLAGVVGDLGWSRTQIDDPERGFSFQLDGPLDGRYDRRQPLTTGQIVNHYPERQLADVLFELGGERRSRRIARAIVRGRPVRSTRHLAELIERAVPRAHWQRIHPATQTFQALRIAVNDELGELDALLAKAPPLLRPGGRMVVVSFHSLEDRRVKQAFRHWASTGDYEVLTRRVVRASDQELEQNPASRSAKLRALERKTEWARRN
jgi:16S rRNA (cytosine1402-N4)-methyltransferase